MGSTAWTSANDLGGIPSLMGSMTCLQSLDHPVIIPSAVPFFHPAMKLSSVSAWVLAVDAMVECWDGE